GATHLVAARFGERTLIVVATRPCECFLVFGDRVANDEQVHATDGVADRATPSRTISCLPLHAQRSTRGVEHLADPAGAEVRPKWLADEADRGLAEPLVEDRVLGVTGHEEDACLGARLPELERQLATTEIRHHDVGYENVNRAFVRRRHGERLLAVARDVY